MESRTQRSKLRPMIQKNSRPRPKTDFSRPRTGMLKAKDTRHRCSPKRKKKVFARGNANFQGKEKKAHGHRPFSTIQCPRPRTRLFRGLAGFKAKDLTFLRLQNVSSRTPPLLFRIPSGDFQCKKLFSECDFFPDHLTVFRVLFFLISKKILANFARIYLEQVGFLKISFVRYITDTLTYSV